LLIALAMILLWRVKRRQNQDNDGRPHFFYSVFWCWYHGLVWLNVFPW
jgi:hypothetical protein